MDEIRNSVKAIIIANEKLLVTRNEDALGVFHLLPGGGQRHGETLADALVRECREEIAARVVVGELLFVREYIGSNHEFAESDGKAHQVEFMFHCRLHDGDRPHIGSLPDIYQTGVDWLSLNELPRVRFYPAGLVDPLRQLACHEPVGDCYLGDVN